MERRVFVFFFLVMVAFSLAAYLVAQDTLGKLATDRQEQQRQSYAVIRDQLRSSYHLLDELLQARSSSYIALHQQALDWLAERENGDNILLLQQQLMVTAGFPIDVFVISDDLIITESSFAPDLGLDFKLPVFVDAQNYLRIASEQQRTLISKPTLELASRQYKLYSYSPLPSGGYLELGFVDPEIQRYFDSYLNQSRAHPGVKIDLFFEVWNSMLIQLGKLPNFEGENKTQLIAQQEERMRLEHQTFREMVPGQVQYFSDSDTYKAQIYDVLLSVKPFPDVEMRVLSKVTFTDNGFTDIERRVRNFSIIMMAMALLLLFVLMFLVRFHLVKPIKDLVAAMTASRRIDLERTNSIPELQFLATNYNQMLNNSQKQVAELEHLTIRDPLTDIYNRRHFDTVINDELARAKRNGTVVAFAMLDVDCFKAYNDLYGHQHGDIILKRLAKLMHNYFRRAGDFVFRYGGEEFAILVTDTADKQMVERFEGLRILIDQAQLPHMKSSVADHLTVSIGICLTDHPSLYGPKALIDRADQALYQAKQSGRNRVVFCTPTAAPDDGDN